MPESKHGCPLSVRALVIDDLGSGALADLALLAEEPAAGDSLRMGVDLVTFSGDKLLGSPRAGIVLGTREAVGRLRTHPLARAVRIDKLNLAALDALLRLYLDPRQALARIPTLALLDPSPRDAPRTRRPAARGRRRRRGGRVGRPRGRRVAGRRGGERRALALTPETGGVDELAARLRAGTPAVLGYVHEGRLLDLLGGP